MHRSICVERADWESCVWTDYYLQY